jgi:hypothetical protein
MLTTQRNAFRIKRVCGEPRGLAPAGSPTPEMVAGSLNQATAKLYYDIQSANGVSTRLQTELHTCRARYWNQDSKDEANLSTRRAPGQRRTA